MEGGDGEMGLISGNPNGTGSLDSIKETLELLAKAPDNNGYFGRLIKEIEELATLRASLILQGHDEESEALRDALIQFSEDPRYKPFFDRKKALDALKQYRATIQSAENQAQSGRRR